MKPLCISNDVESKCWNNLTEIEEKQVKICEGQSKSRLPFWFPCSDQTYYRRVQPFIITHIETQVMEDEIGMGH